MFFVNFYDLTCVIKYLTYCNVCSCFYANLLFARFSCICTINDFHQHIFSYSFLSTTLSQNVSFVR